MIQCLLLQSEILLELTLSPANLGVRNRIVKGTQQVFTHLALLVLVFFRPLCVLQRMSYLPQELVSSVLSQLHRDSTEEVLDFPSLRRCRLVCTKWNQNILANWGEDLAFWKLTLAYEDKERQVMVSPRSSIYSLRVKANEYFHVDAAYVIVLGSQNNQPAEKRIPDLGEYQRKKDFGSLILPTPTAFMSNLKLPMSHL